MLHLQLQFSCTFRIRMGSEVSSPEGEIWEANDAGVSSADIDGLGGQFSAINKRAAPYETFGETIEPDLPWEAVLTVIDTPANGLREHGTEEPLVGCYRSATTAINTAIDKEI